MGNKPWRNEYSWSWTDPKGSGWVSATWKFSSKLYVINKHLILTLQYGTYDNLLNSSNPIICDFNDEGILKLSFNK